MEADAWSIVDMDVVEATAVGPDASAMIASEPVGNGTIFPAWRVKINGSARGMIAAPTGTGDARAAAISGNYANSTKFCTNLA